MNNRGERGEKYRSCPLLPAATLLCHLSWRNLAEQVPLDVLVREDLFRIDTLAHGEEVVKARVELAQVGRRQSMGLGPVRLAGEERKQDRGESSKVVAVGHGEIERPARCDVRPSAIVPAWARPPLETD